MTTHNFLKTVVSIAATSRIDCKFLYIHLENKVNVWAACIVVDWPGGERALVVM